jgi:biopolymer transport protein ExbB
MIGKIIDIWIGGGWVMVALALLAVILYTQAFQLFFFTLRCRIKGEPETEWTQWLDRPADAPEGETRKIFNYVTRFGVTSADVRSCFDEIRFSLVNTIDRRTRFISTMVSAAPLLGLLGTVLGMLSTFFGLATSGGAETMGVVAGGIRVALITTATGLTIALPGLFLVMLIRRRKQQLSANLARLESLLLSRTLAFD